jgi:hypothetical protein
MRGREERGGFGSQRSRFRRAMAGHQAEGFVEPARKASMMPAELIAVGKSVFGYGWRGHIARAIGVTWRMIAYWQSGERVIPPERARGIRMLGDMGPVGSIIPASVRTAAPDLAPFLCHRIAVRVLKDLAAAGIVLVESKGEHRQVDLLPPRAGRQAGPGGQARPASPPEPAPQCLRCAACSLPPSRGSRLDLGAGIAWRRRSFWPIRPSRFAHHLVSLGVPRREGV